MWEPSFHHTFNYLNLHKSTSEREQTADGGLHHMINYLDSPAFRFESYHLVLPGEHIPGLSDRDPGVRKGRSLG